MVLILLFEKSPGFGFDPEWAIFLQGVLMLLLLAGSWFTFFLLGMWWERRKMPKKKYNVL